MDWSASGTKLKEDKARTLGPIYSVQYTHSRSILKLTAQLPALGQQDSHEAELYIRPGQGANWKKVAHGKLHQHSFTVPFRVEDGYHERRIPHCIQLRTGEINRNTSLEGTIRKDPAKEDPSTAPSRHPSQPRSRKSIWLSGRP